MKRVERYVYFIRPVGMDGPIKIGISNVPEKRLKALASWSPFPLEVIATIPAGMTEEAFIHRCFCTQHLHREWFRSSPLLIETINRIMAGETIEQACIGLPLGPSVKTRAKGLPYRPFRRKRGSDARFFPSSGASA